MTNKWSIIYTDHSNKFIHLKHLAKSNPDAQILCANTKNDLPKNIAWRNGDLLFRNWIKKNIDTIKYDKIALLEWDVLITKKLPDIVVSGLIAKDVNTCYKNPTWLWFKEIDLLDEYQKYAIGISPFGVIYLNRQCIDYLIDPEFDDLYKKNIFSELRLPTILNSKNIPITSFKMPNVWHTPVNYRSNIQDIYHPIKYKIKLT